MTACPGPRHLAYYRERALGGAGMIVVEGASVHPSGALTRGRFLISDDIVPGLTAITDACHEHGAVMIQQLNHSGQHADFDNSWHANWSPSGLASLKDADGSHAMTEAEIEDVIDSVCGRGRTVEARGLRRQ